jgi:hypothetical protein
VAVTAKTGAIPTSTTDLKIAKRPDGATLGLLTGSMDELRLQNVARSADWIRLEGRSQKPGVTPVSDLVYDSTTYVFTQLSPVTPTPAPTVFGNATRYVATPALPAGLSLNDSGQIVGTPTAAAAAADYQIAAFSDSAWFAHDTVNIAVSLVPPSNVVASLDTAEYEGGKGRTDAGRPPGAPRRQRVPEVIVMTRRSTSPESRAATPGDDVKGRGATEREREGERPLRTSGPGPGRGERHRR